MSERDWETSVNIGMWASVSISAGDGNAEMSKLCAHHHKPRFCIPALSITISRMIWT